MFPTQTSKTFIVADFPDVTISFGRVTAWEVYKYLNNWRDRIVFRFKGYSIFPLYFHYGNPVYLSTSNYNKADVTSYHNRGYVLVHRSAGIQFIKDGAIHKSPAYHRMIAKEYTDKYNIAITKVLEHNKKILKECTTLM